MMIPRFIEAKEILDERDEQRKYASSPHGSGRGWSSMFWVSCDCHRCRDHYDPTGEETAKYLNMDPASFFTDQVELPSFASTSKAAKESLFFNASSGFYFDADGRVRTLDSFLEQLTPPLALQPRHILHISNDGTKDRFFLSEGKDATKDRFFLSEDKTMWTRHTWKSGQSVFYSDEENPPILADTGNKALRLRLKELFA